MAKKTTYCCDRCGKEFDKRGFTRRFHIPRKISSYILFDGWERDNREIDLCEECSAAFDYFIMNKEVKPNERKAD